MDQAHQRHAERSDHARKRDDSIRAKRTYTPGHLAKNPKTADRWFANPNRSDIVGIDMKKGAKRTKKKAIKAKTKVKTKSITKKKP